MRKITNEYIVGDVITSIMKNIVEKETNVANRTCIKRKHDIEQNRMYHLTVPQCLREFLTSTKFPLLDVSTVRDMDLTGEDSYKKWRLQCQALSIRPKKIIEMLQYFCKHCREFTIPNDPLNEIVVQCEHCSDKTSLKFTYFFRLLLLDQTGLVEVVSYGDESIYFFNDISPHRLIGDLNKISQLQLKIDKLDNYYEEIDNLESLPMVDVCVISNSKSSKRFRNFLFQTSLI